MPVTECQSTQLISRGYSINSRIFVTKSYYISQVPCGLWLVDLAIRILKRDCLTSWCAFLFVSISKRYNEHLTNLVFSVSNVRYCTTFHFNLCPPPASLGGLKLTWENKFRNSQYGPRTELVREISVQDILLYKVLKKSTCPSRYAYCACPWTLHKLPSGRGEFWKCLFVFSFSSTITTWNWTEKEVGSSSKSRIRT